MKLITRETDYAMRALCFISHSEKKLTSVDDLVKSLKMPRPFIRKIMQVLSKKHIVESVKGKNGGFNLALSTKKIYLVDIMRIFQGELKLNECLFKADMCPNIKKCKLRKSVDKIEKFMKAELKKITLEYLTN